MKTLQVDLSDQMAHEISEAVESGKFENASEVVRAALREFVSRRRFDLMEQQQLKDIAWAGTGLSASNTQRVGR
jgi:putative addiction module CopG family antidote